MMMTTQSETQKPRNRGGRPPLLDIERRVIKFHGGFTFAEAEFIAQKAEAAGISEPEYIRHAVLNRELKTVPAINKDTYHELGKIGVNINQIAKILNSGSNANPEINDAFGKLKTVIAQLRQQLLGIQ
jgi:hypothetical protein